MSRPMFDEMHASPDEVRRHYQNYARWLAAQPPAVMADRRAEAEVIFRRVGITFAVYGDKDEDAVGNERLIPFDQIHSGMRVEAVWVDDDDLATSFENIKWWRPNGEEDADPASYAQHV